ncbi:MAG: hypothetical protein NZ480_00205 [Bdellovibrionaceae bacterium]|nr:hypothetical protein [Pseudobdellovibrionaceae bacterium]
MLLGFLAERGVDPHKFINLVCHISNLQLRVLRKYFACERFKKNDELDWPRLEKIITRWVVSWHPNGDEAVRKQRSLFIKELKKSGCIKVFEEMDPRISIPPFEDMNNRRPPKCQALLLNPEGLKEFPINDWVIKLEKHLIDRGLKCIVDRASALPNIYRRFQLYLEMNTRLIEINFRHISKRKNRTDEDIRDITNLFSSDANRFLNFLKEFFDELDEAKSGLINKDLKIVRVCLCNPPQKKNIVKTQLQRIMLAGISVENRPKVNEVIEWIKKEGVINGEKVTNHLKSVSECVKKHGNLLKEKIIEVYSKIQLNQKLNDDEKRLKNILEKVEAFTMAFAERFQVNQTEVKRFNNIWSQAQIYNVALDNPTGFSKTCKDCTLDNLIRSEMIKITESEEAAMFQLLGFGRRSCYPALSS